MKGYVYIDNDRNLSVRSKDFIDNEDPYFWSRNAHIIDTVWQFDSDNEDSMYRILSTLRRYELKNEVVVNFCASIGFDLEAFLIKQRTKPITK